MRSEYVTKEVLELLLKRMHPGNALAVRLSLVTGLRIGDCLKTLTSDLNGGYLNYTAQKTGKPGVAFVGEALQNELLLNSGGSGFCFPGKNGDKPRTRQAVYTDLKKCAKDLKITENVTPHTARKVFAVEELKNKSFAEVQEELQHSNSSITMLYACSDKLNGATLGKSTKTQKNDEKRRKTELLTPNFCENCVFSIGLENLIDIVVERVFLAIEQQKISPEP